MAANRLSSSDERVVGELVAVPGAAVVGAHFHPGQAEHFEVLDGTLGYDEIVFERPPRAVQRALAMTVAPIALRRGRSVTAT